MSQRATYIAEQSNKNIPVAAHDLETRQESTPMKRFTPPAPSKSM
jgi:hypothetical protein